MKLSLEFRLTASFIIIGMMVLLGGVALLKSFQRDKRFLEERIFEHEHKIEDFLFLVREYVGSKNRSVLLKLKQDVDRVGYEISVINHGGVLLRGNENVTMEPLQGDVMTKVGKAYEESFNEVAVEIDKLWAESIRLSEAVRTDKSIEGLEEERSGYRVEDLQEFLERRSSGLISKNRTFKSAITGDIQAAEDRYTVFYGIVLLVSIILLIDIYLLLRKKLLNPLGLAYEYACYLINKEPKFGDAKFAAIYDVLNKVDNIFDETVVAVEELGKGTFEMEYSELIAEHKIGKELKKTQRLLSYYEEHEAQNQWRAIGLVQLSEILVNEQYESLDELSFAFVRFLVKYLNVNQGAMFQVKEDFEGKYLEMIGAFAYDKKKYLQKRLPIDQGLIGQALIEKQYLYLNSLPEGYTEITSGLGEATPKYLLICPVLFNDDVVAVLELASFGDLKKHEIDFVKDAVERLAATVSVYLVNSNTRKLLEDSIKMNKTLKEQEDQMRKNAEELHHTQEELSNKLIELREESNLNKNILKAISKNTAMIEFDMEGNILAANMIYTDLMGYKEEDLIGIHEKNLVPVEEVSSPRYKMLWDSLKEGTSSSGEYKRLRSDEQMVWLEGSYNPIFDLEGQPYKVIKFAHFTTEDKQREYQTKTKINLYESHFSILELRLDGAIKSTSVGFQGVTGYSRKEMRNKFLQDWFVEIEDKTAFEQALEKADSGMAQTLKVYLYHSDKTSHRYKISINQQKDMNMESKGFLVVMQPEI
ncbi:PAS domain S-box protein [Limibacter armeniacum]|uniref:PAS domain S-box protein n=1 Tax=Limibacter armeniacum TaxID=466084 RepID=UPI002FE5E15B